jgi:hypothetical protein
MKAHVDAESGLAHTVVTIAANVNDKPAHCFTARTVAFGDAGYRGRGYAL